MRHLKQKSPSFGRHRGPRKALIRGLVQSLVEHERIKTTLPKAKCVRPLIEKAITMGKRGDLHSRRLLLSRYPHKPTVSKIIETLSPRFKDRLGGYTRIIKLGFRSGDQAPLAYLEFVDYDMQQTVAFAQKEGAKKEIAQKEGAKKEIAKKEVVKKEDTKKEAKKSKEEKKIATKKEKRKIVDQNKKQKKYLLAQKNKQRKRVVKQQKKSRRINRKK